MTDLFIDETEFNYLINSIDDYAKILEEITLQYLLIISYIKKNAINDYNIRFKLNVIHSMASNIFSNLADYVDSIVLTSKKFLKEIELIGENGGLYGLGFFD